MLRRFHITTQDKSRFGEDIQTISPFLSNEEILERIEAEGDTAKARVLIDLLLEEGEAIPANDQEITEVRSWQLAWMLFSRGISSNKIEVMIDNVETSSEIRLRLAHLFSDGRVCCLTLELNPGA